MSVIAQAFLTTTAQSLETGREVGRRLGQGFDGSPSLVLTYLTVNHNQEDYLRGIREVLGDQVAVVGCSAQGVMGKGNVREDGFAAAAMALGGESLRTSHGCVEDIAENTIEKGAELGRKLMMGLTVPPRIVVLHYDALCGVDPERLIEGVSREVPCPIVGGAAAHSFDYQSLLETYQYFGDRVLTRAASACAISGDFSLELGICHGCSPVGVELTVTRAENNVLVELDGRRASALWAEICGPVSTTDPSAALAIGVPVDGAAGQDYFVRAAYRVDPESGTVALGPAIPTGTQIMLHHRTVEDVLLGARRMGQDLKARLNGKRPRAALGFECGARTGPFLGSEATLAENLELQQTLGDGVAWLGMMPWGELFPTGGKPSFHNYSYVVLVLAD
jgi:hypothetical protein